MPTQDRARIRRQFTETRRKRLAGLPLEPLEALIAQVIEEHPEYHPLLDNPETALARDFAPEQGTINPFLHMGMHISLREQVGTDRPSGIRRLFQRLVEATGDAHTAEHRLMDCLGQALWEAQRNGREPDEQAYLECVRRLAD